MENLKVIERDGNLTVDSRDVAAMVGKNHAHLLRDIRNYAEVLNKTKNGLVDFFIESGYKDKKSEERTCYLITRKGCEFIANKLTGKKGIEFTASYINKFHEMEARLGEGNNSITGISEIFKRIGNIENILENNMTINFGQQQAIQKTVKENALRALGGKKSLAYSDARIRTKIYSAIWRAYKNHFKVASYRDTLTYQYAEAINFVTCWSPEEELEELISETTSN